MVNNKKIKKDNCETDDNENDIDEIDYFVNKNKTITLNLPNIDNGDYPSVSIVTHTANKGELFKLAVHQFLNFDYPRDKLQWVILDYGKEKIKKYLNYADKSQLLYMTIDGNKNYNLGDLRNNCIKHGAHDIIVHMDDIIFYPKNSVNCRVKSLLKYFHKGVECVGCDNCLYYLINNNTCANVFTEKNSLIESSLCYTKRFWEKRNYTDADNVDENINFLKNRIDKLIKIPNQFVLMILDYSKDDNNNKNNLNKEQKDYIENILGEDVINIIYNKK